MSDKQREQKEARRKFMGAAVIGTVAASAKVSGVLFSIK